MNGPGTQTEKCHKQTAAEESPPLIQNGKIILQTHHIGWIVAGLFAAVATFVSLWLVNKHLQWYTNKKEQRYIVRILFMVPIYAIVSFASYLFWDHSTALLLIRDGYESTVLTSFFYLLLVYLSPDPEGQKAIFMKFGLSRNADKDAIRKGEQPKKWVFPLGSIRAKPQDGLYFLQMMKWGVLQYCVIRPTTTLVAVVLNYQGLYCEESWGLGRGHIYITIIVSTSVTVAMYCLIQLYVSVSKHLSPHKPLLKLFAIKAVVFLTFWQATFLSLLSLFGVVKDTKYMTAGDINIGIGALLETFEMTVFALLHIRAFTYKPYVSSVHSKSQEIITKTPRLRALAHAMDFRETFREIWVGCIYIFDKLCRKEPTLDTNARRFAHYESAFGRTRPSRFTPPNNFNLESKASVEGTAPVLPAVEIEVEEHVDVEGERQWLGTGNDYGYGLEYIRRGRSEGLEVQIENELENRGYATRLHERSRINSLMNKEAPNERRQHSWWRNIYNRISESSPNTEDVENAYHPIRYNVPEVRRRSLYDHEYDDPPHGTHQRQARIKLSDPQIHSTLEADQQDILTPLPIFRGPYHEATFPHPLTSPGHPALHSPDVSSPQLVRSDSLLYRIFPVRKNSMSPEILSTQSNSRPQMYLPSNQFIQESGSIDTPTSLTSPRGKKGKASQHPSHRRETASHDPFPRVPPISFVTASTPFPVPTSPRRNSSHHGLIINPIRESFTSQIPYVDTHPPFSPVSSPSSTQTHLSEIYEPYTQLRLL